LKGSANVMVPQHLAPQGRVGTN